MWLDRRGFLSLLAGLGLLQEPVGSEDNYPFDPLPTDPQWYLDFKPTLDVRIEQRLDGAVTRVKARFPDGIQLQNGKLRVRWKVVERVDETNCDHFEYTYHDAFELTRNGEPPPTD